MKCFNEERDRFCGELSCCTVCVSGNKLRLKCVSKSRQATTQLEATAVLLGGFFLQFVRW